MDAPPSTGPLMDPRQRAFLAPISRLYATNPFEPEWQALLKAAVHDVYLPGEGVGGSLARLSAKACALIDAMAQHAVTECALKLAAGVLATPDELEIYQGAALYVLWCEVGGPLQELIKRQERNEKNQLDFPLYDAFVARYRFFFGYAGLSVPDPVHLLEFYYQAWRAFYFIWTKIRGRSKSIAAARAALWRAIMPGNICDYARHLHRSVHKLTVLLTGESGTGKELAAECIGWSCLIPFDEAKKQFTARYDADYHTHNLCETPDSLLESTLFGHKRGSFTGATEDAIGLFGRPKMGGVLFLDEIGELSKSAQVKLLRPLQTRKYMRVGETTPREFFGRPIVATLENLEAMVREKRFRRDLFERLNVLRVHMPALRDRIAEDPDELEELVGELLAKDYDNPWRRDEMVRRIVAAIQRDKYDWPGNVRELLHYTQRFALTDGRMPGPAAFAAATQGASEAEEAPPTTYAKSSGNLGPNAKAGMVSPQEIERDVVTRIYVACGMNMSETVRRTGFSWPKVQRLIDDERVQRFLREEQNKPGAQPDPKARGRGAKALRRGARAKRHDAALSRDQPARGGDDPPDDKKPSKE